MACRSERKAQGGQQALAGRARIVGGARDALSFGAKRRRHYPDIAARYWKSLILPASSPIAPARCCCIRRRQSATSDSLTGLLEQVQAAKLQAQTTQQTLLTLRREDEESSAMPIWGTGTRPRSAPPSACYWAGGGLVALVASPPSTFVHKLHRALFP